MNKYFAKVSQELSNKNNLDKNICRLLKAQFERRVFSEEELKDSFSLFDRLEKQLHENNPRCKPIKIHVNNHDEDYRVYTQTIVINFYKIINL